MMNRFFKNVTTLEDLKAEYKKLALQHHPDRGGDQETMKAINAEYDEMFARVKDTHKTKDGKTYTKETAEAPETFRDMISKLLKMDGIHIEVIGCFIWISGDTKPHRDELKKMGFRWHSKKSCWYKCPEDYRKKSRREISMEEIRSMYGVRFEADAESEKRLTA